MSTIVDVVPGTAEVRYADQILHSFLKERFQNSTVVSRWQELQEEGLSAGSQPLPNDGA